MKKIIRIPAMIFGSVAILLAMPSCGEDDGDSIECCSVSYSYTDDDGTYTSSGRICEDGTYTYTYTGPDGTESGSGNWKDDDDNEFDTWDEYKSYLLKVAEQDDEFNVSC